LHPADRRTARLRLGLGVLIVGDSGIGKSKFERWEPSRDYERLGLTDATYEILGIPLPLIQMPVAPGPNLAILVEIAARKLPDRLERQLQLISAQEVDDPEIDDDSGAGEAR